MNNLCDILLTVKYRDLDHNVFCVYENLCKRMSSNSHLSLTRNASSSRCDAVNNQPAQNLSPGAYVVPWKRCSLCWPSDGAGPFRSPRDFCRHLRDNHCTREGGSFVCRYGMNGVCPSLPVDGVSDRDYEDHVARDHVAGESNVSSQAPTTVHSSALPHCSYRYSFFATLCVHVNTLRYEKKFDLCSKTDGSQISLT